MSEPDGMDLDFTGDIWHWRGPSPYYFVTVPDEESHHLHAVSTVVTYGWGMIPVRARIGATEWQTIRMVVLPAARSGIVAAIILGMGRAVGETMAVIMVTGNASSRVAGEVIKDGAYSYLPKPVKFQYLDHIVATILGPSA